MRRRTLTVLFLLALAGCAGCRSGDVAASAPEAAGAAANAPRLRIEARTALDDAPGANPQVEPHVVADPRDPRHLVAAWMSVSSGPWEVRLARSGDGGRSWRRVSSPAAPETRRAFDPWLAWAPDGSALYLAVVEVRPGSEGGEEWRLPVFRSRDGGASWSRWAEVPGRTLDRPVLLAGPRALWVLATEAVATAPIVVARAAAGEGEFRLRGRYQPPGSNAILSDAELTGEGELVFSFTDRGSIQDHRPRPLLAVRFDDRAQSFGEPRTLGSALFVGAPQLALDLSQGPHRGRLYSVWGDRTEEGAASLRVAASDDGGRTWSASTAVPLAGEETTWVTVPTVAVGPRGGLGVTWREHTGDLVTGCSTVRFAASLDGGESFPLRRELSSAPSCPDRPENRLDLGGIPFLRRWPGGGDYAGLAVGGDGVFHPVWADSSAGAWHIRTARAELGPGAAEGDGAPALRDGNFTGDATEGSERRAARVVLSRLGEGGGWRAVYELPRPVDRLRFERRAAYHREDVWTVETPGWEWARAEDGAQILRQTGSGEGSPELVFTFPTHDENLLKEYELFQAFSDGSAAVYSGHFHATAELVEGGEAIAVRTLHLEPPAGGHLAAGGDLFREPTEWTDPDGHDGTYLYLGSIEPVETEHVLALLDPGLPEWVLERLQEDLPWYFAAYTERLGVRLPWKPMVLFSFSGAESRGYSSGGGTLPALVQMSIRGEAWRTSTPDTEGHLGFLFAHEVAHLWNGQLVSYPGTSESWLHEGSADAFAHRLLRQRQILSPDADRSRLGRRLTDCARGLSEGALDEAGERGEPGLYYGCGEIVAWWTELALPEREDLFSFWGDLIRAARERGGTYDQELYFSRLRALGGSEESIRRLRRFVSEPLEDPFEFLLTRLPRAGWPVHEAKGRLPEEERGALVRPVVRELMGASCDGRYSFSQHPEGFVLHPLEGCSGWDRERILHSIQGYAVLEEGDRARRTAREICTQGGALELGFAGDDSLEVACDAEIPPAPRRFAVELTPTVPSPARKSAGG